ncbi:hypothetical protein [Negadavirga shengliensis]|uniref:Uncharacterized protein n=1 Tax=Negadavirga shengliensis TaxID=1389218 RepID=A0ABV9T4G2_9BACT
MNRLVKYHIITVGPIALIGYLYYFQNIGNGLFALLMVLYAFVYRNIVDYKKLKRKGLVTRKQFIRSLGLISFKYYNELMFEE